MHIIKNQRIAQDRIHNPMLKVVWATQFYAKSGKGGYH